MNTRYLPVDPDFFDTIKKEESKKDTAVIHYFTENNSVAREVGQIKGIATNHRHEDFLTLHTGREVRIDRIITIGGKPGPAYDEYDSYALACLDCMGGMD